MPKSWASKRLGLHPTAWECLSLLFEHGSMPAGRLAELTGLTTGAITGLVDRLEEAGFVVRGRDRDDRRKVIVEVVQTASGDVMALFEPMMADMHDLNGQFTDDQIGAIQECLAAAAAILRKHALCLRADAQEDRRRSQ
ncbi:MAG: MarR family winged helix-turn-helix transcriptional regulator [Acidimicrobiales bacterium]